MRPATPADSAAIATLEAALFADPWPAAAIESYWTDALPLAWLALDEAEHPIGYAMLRAVPAAGEAELLRIATVPAFRRTGVARGLLAAALAELDARGLDGFLEVHAANLPAQALYLGLGFALEGRRRGYYRDGGDACLYARRKRADAG